MLVVTIIALLAGLLVYNQIGNVKDAQIVAARANMNTIKVNLLSYQMNAGMMPSTEQGLKALVTRPESDPRPMAWRKVLDEEPRDPWGKAFIYKRPGVKHPDSFDLSSAGPDGQAGNDDDVWQ